MADAADGRARSAWLAAVGCLLAWVAEEYVHRRLGAATDVATILPAAALLAGGAALFAAVGQKRLHPLAAAALPVAAAAALALVRPLRDVLGSWMAGATAAAAGGMVVGLLLAWTLARAARARIGRLALAVPLAVMALVSVRTAATGRNDTVGIAGAVGPDVVLIVMDTTRRDHLSVYGYPQPTSPSLEAFARDAEVYEDAWSVAPWTAPSHASMFTGVLPAEHGVDGEEPSPLPESLPTLARVFRGAGYRTAGVVSNPNLAAPRWDRDYDRYSTPWVRGPHSLACVTSFWHIRACDPWEWPSRGVTRRAFDLARDWWGENAGRPRFLFVNLMDPHRPYHPPDELFRAFLPGVSWAEAYAVDTDPDTYQVRPGVSPHDERIIRGLYDAEIAAMDREIGRFFDWLRERGDLDRTIVAITADHGERLGERGLVGHEGVGPTCMDSFLLHVPLIIRYAGRICPGRVQRRVQLDHLAAHLLRLAGVNAPPPFDVDAFATPDTPLVVAQFRHPAWILGRLAARTPPPDLSNLGGNRVFVADRRHALVARVTDTVESELLVDMEADPGWSHDVRAELPDVVEALAAEAARLPRFPPLVPAEPDPTTVEELKSLGYLR